MTDAHTNLIAAMKMHGMKKLVTMSAFGVGDSMQSVFLPMRLVLNHSGMVQAFKDHNTLEKVVRNSGLEWTLVKPCMLSDGERKEVMVWGNKGKGIGLMPKISRLSVARFIVECVEGDKWNGMTPVISDS